MHCDFSDRVRVYLGGRFYLRGFTCLAFWFAHFQDSCDGMSAASDEIAQQMCELGGAEPTAFLGCVRESRPDCDSPKSSFYVSSEEYGKRFVYGTDKFASLQNGS